MENNIIEYYFGGKTMHEITFDYIKKTRLMNEEDWA